METLKQELTTLDKAPEAISVVLDVADDLISIAQTGTRSDKALADSVGEHKSSLSVLGSLRPARAGCGSVIIEHKRLGGTRRSYAACKICKVQVRTR